MNDYVDNIVSFDMYAKEDIPRCRNLMLTESTNESSIMYDTYRDTRPPFKDKSEIPVILI
jgi:hypothetical protein